MGISRLAKPCIYFLAMHSRVYIVSVAHAVISGLGMAMRTRINRCDLKL